MNKTLVACTAAVAALACVESLLAHHSMRTIEVSTSVWVKGTVVRYEPISPHTLFELEERRTDGQLQRWTIEGPFPGRLSRILTLNGMRADEDFLKAGDVVEVCGFFPKRSESTTATADRVPPPYVHGHLLVMPDGQMESWGPYGKLDNCIREGDRPPQWADFLNADPLAREFWCNVRRLVGVASTTPTGIVDEINRLLTESCD